MKNLHNNSQTLNLIGRLQQQWAHYHPHFDTSAEVYQAVFTDLVARYSESWRCYHTLEHIDEVLGHLDPWLQDPELAPSLFMATWFHDAVYKPWRKNNEQQSAVLAVKTLKELGWPQERAQGVGDAVLATYHPHMAQVPTAFKALLDSDLAILGADWERYETYSHQIREEYRIFPTLLYRQGRIQVLRTFLERKPLYCLPEFRDRFEEQARLNLQQELEMWTR